MSFFSKQAFAEDEDDSDSDIDCEFGNAIFSQTNHTIKPIQIIKNEVTTTTTNKPIVHHQILGNISDIQSLDLDTEDDINDLDKTVPTKHIESGSTYEDGDFDETVAAKRIESGSAYEDSISIG
eukprot:69706_1